MDSEALKIEKLKGYRNAFWAFLILTYVIGRAGEMIKQSGGTSEGTAIFIVAIQVVAPLVMIFCGVMWVKLKRKKATIPTRDNTRSFQNCHSECQARNLCLSIWLKTEISHPAKAGFEMTKVSFEMTCT